MPRTQFLWLPSLALVAATFGCSVEMPVAQAPATSSPAPAPNTTTTPPPNTTTIPAPDSTTTTAAAPDGTIVPQTSADPGAVTPPAPGAESMPVEGATPADPAAPDYSVPGSPDQPGSPGIPDGAAPAAAPDDSAPSPDGTIAPPGMPEGGMPDYGQPGVATAPPEKSFEEMTLAERAESCFEKGEETEGFRWLYAHAIASEMDDAATTLDKLRWLPGPKRPSLAARFGVAVKFDAPVDLVTLATAMPAIGDAVPGLIRGKKDQPAGGADTSGSASNPAKEIPTTAPATLRFFTGDLGAKFLERFETSRTEKEWGEVLSEMGGAGSLVANADANSPYGSEGYATAGSAPASESGSSDSKDDRKKSGPSLSLEGGDQISPGIVWLGFDSSAASAARKGAPLGLDCVLLVDVKVQLGRNAPPRNKTKVMAADVASAKVIGSTPLLDQFDIYEMRELRPNAPDPVDQAIETLFEAIDPLYTMQDMPEISAEAALNRARQLIADPPADPLPALAEMRYYLHKGLMDEAQYAIACKNLATVPEIGEKLISQNAEDRIAAVEKLVESMSVDDEEGSSGDSGAEAKSDKDEPGAESPAGATPTAGAPVEP